MTFYYKFVIAGVVVWLFSSTIAAWRDGLPRGETVLILVSTAMAFFLGARLHSLVLEQGVGVTAILDRPTLLIAGGLRLPGGVVLSLLHLAFVTTITQFPVRRLLDPIALGSPLGMATARIGCFVEGCCFGTLSHLPWAVTYPFGSEAYRAHAAQHLLDAGTFTSLPVHPLALYMSLSSVALFLLLVHLWPRRLFQGEALIALLALRSLTAVALESLREPNTLPVPFRSGFWLALGLVASAAWVGLRWLNASRPLSSNAPGIP